MILSFNNYLPKGQIPSLFILEIESSKALQSLLEKEYERNKTLENFKNLKNYIKNNFESYFKMLDEFENLKAFEEENKAVYGENIYKLIVTELRMWLDRHHNLIFQNCVESLNSLELEKVKEKFFLKFFLF